MLNVFSLFKILKHKLTTIDINYKVLKYSKNGQLIGLERLTVLLQTPLILDLTHINLEPLTLSVSPGPFPLPKGGRIGGRNQNHVIYTVWVC